MTGFPDLGRLAGDPQVVAGSEERSVGELELHLRHQKNSPVCGRDDRQGTSLHRYCFNSHNCCIHYLFNTECDVAKILKAAGAKEGLPSEDLLPLVYDELRCLAAARMKGEAEGQTLQATALVHEAWLRVSGGGGRTWNDRSHFFRIAALEMRRILVENARRKACVKRGPDLQRVDIEGLQRAETQPNERILLIDEVLQRLEAEDPDSARIITLKFFGGLTNREVAEMEKVTERTIERHWAYARTRLYEMLSDET